MKRRKRCKHGRHVTTDPRTSRSLRSDRPENESVATTNPLGRSLRSDRSEIESFIQTELAGAIGDSFLHSLGGYMSMDMLIKGAFELITDESKAGACLWITNRRGLEYWPTPMEQAKYLVGSTSTKRTSFKVTSNIKLPQSFEKIIVHTLSHNFRNATRNVRTPLRLPIGPHQVLLKIIYAGVNASDVNFSSGRYFSGGSPKLPFDAGFEGVGLIAAVGESVKNLQVGTPAAVMTFGAYAEYMIVSSKHVLPVPRPDPEVVAMLTSGLTALTALEKAGQMKSGETVLVTAAAGGTGQFAVQLAKLAGNKVIATCGGSEKAKLLKELGVDRVIDYKAEDIKTVLKKEFPKGVDIIYESVGGRMFDLCLNALAVYGRLIVIGMISQLITDESKAGACLWITNRRGLEYWPTPMEQAKYLLGSTSTKRTSFKLTSNIKLPQSFEKIIVHALSHNFRNATRIVRAPLQLPIGPHQVLLKIIYAGVNASDVNFSSGRYFSGGSPKLPFDAGFEGVGLIAAVGESVKNLQVGTPAAVMTFGAYSEYMIVSSKHVLPVPRPDPEVVAMLTSGLTALIALEKAGQMKSGETVLVTAAAGGTGQFAVQLAKLAGNKVIATCGGSEKAKLLKELGVDRVIDYKAEDIKTVLKKEFPKGVDIIYESVGGRMFDLCLNALAVYGRLIVIGMISQVLFY
ncbi:hypothetical protein F2Q68_00043424 [Brassica cretica]|uniref:Enoyl reductase (ER) domain-containing protein n=1 Tax=Brassica cretica TaxID=69181 RepID=A0A8S9LJF8_BRACR|nr:hypothetical protein F2Q68_00043424 [Brassica cretica]